MKFFKSHEELKLCLSFKELRLKIERLTERVHELERLLKKTGSQDHVDTKEDKSA